MYYLKILKIKLDKNLKYKKKIKIQELDFIIIWIMYHKIHLQINKMKHYKDYILMNLNQFY